jgi:hypothetical protein
MVDHRGSFRRGRIRGQTGLASANARPAIAQSFAQLIRIGKDSPFLIYLDLAELLVS